MINSSTNPNVLKYALSVSLCLCFALVLSLPRGISYAAIPALLLALWVVLRRPASHGPLRGEEKLFLCGMLALPVLTLAQLLLKGGAFDWSLMDEPLRFVLVIPIFLAIRAIGLSRNLIYVGFALGAIGAGSLGLYQKFILGHPVAQGFLHKIIFGDMSLMLGVLASTYLIKSDAPKQRALVVLTVLGCLFGLAGSFSSGTRGGWIALPFMGWLLLESLVERKAVKRAVYALFLLALFAVYESSSFVAARVNNAVGDFYEYFTTDDLVGHGSVSSRFEMWKGALIMFKQHPVLGVGLEQYRTNLHQLIDAGEVKLPTRYDAHHAHSDFLRYLAEMGLLGGIAYMMLFVCCLRYFGGQLGVDKQFAIAGLIFCIGFIDFGLTEAMFKRQVTVAFVAISLATLAGGIAHQARRARLAASQAPRTEAGASQAQASA